jgi:membrane protein required for colicin V production
VFILVGTSLAGSVLAGMVKWVGLGFYDRFLGLGFGALRGGVIVVLFALLAGLTALPETGFWQASLTHGQLESAAKMVIPWVPDSLAAHIRF